MLVTGVLAARELSSVRTQLVKVNRLLAIGEIDRARAVAAKIPASSHRAALLTSGPFWWVSSHVPGLGKPLEVVRGMSVSADRLGRTTLPVLVRLSSDLSPQTLRKTTDSIDLVAIEKAQPDVARSTANVHRALGAVQALPARTWLGQVNVARTDYEAELSRIGGLLDAVDQAARALPEMAGGHGTRRYFLAMQNEAEMRGTGGLPGAFAILEVTNGKMHFTLFSSDKRMLPPQTSQLIETGLDLGPDSDTLYHQSRPNAIYLNSNVSPYFPDAGRVWAAMWEKVSGQHIDGAIGLDPTTLSYFLTAIGPVPLSDGTVLRAENVVALTQKDLYAKFDDQNARKEYLVEILKAVDSRLLTSPRTVALMNAFARAATERRLTVWSSNAGVEKVLEEARIAGTLGTKDQAFTGLVLNNAVGGKLDYYLDRSLTYQRNACHGSREVIVTIKLTNNAPASGLPAYVTGRLDRQRVPSKVGDNRVLLDYFATYGTQFIGATLNGEPFQMGAVTAYGKSVFRTDLELPRGNTQTLVLTLQEPPVPGKIIAMAQPGVRPIALEVRDFC